MRFGVISIMLALTVLQCQSQTIRKDLTTLFAFQVVSIDDFFDRFNFRKNTSFQYFIKRNYPEYQLTREKLVASLFNMSNPALIKEQAAEFIAQVTDTLQPRYMNYKDDNWFAELNCRIFYKTKPKNLALVMKVERSPNGGYRWSLVSARADFLKLIPGRDDSLAWQWKKHNRSGVDAITRKYSLSPVSHGIDFTNVDEVFINKANAREYANREFYSGELEKLIQLIKKSEVKFGYVNKITYHLLQLNDWILVVEYFNRNDKDAGWRINRLYKVSAAEKEEYLKKQLTIQKS